MFKCAICGKALFTENPRKYFCRMCYNRWKTEIISKAEWVNVCINSEHAQRRQSIKDRKLVYLGDGYDIGENDGEPILVKTDYEEGY